MYLTKENKLLGPPRLMQIRVKNDTCGVSSLFKHHFRDCYAYFTFDNEDTLSFGLKNGSAWNYQFGKGNDDDGVDYVEGEFGYYPTNSFGQVLFLDKHLNEAILQELYDGKWIDRGTRAIIVEFSLFNANLDIFCFVQ